MIIPLLKTKDGVSQTPSKPYVLTSRKSRDGNYESFDTLEQAEHADFEDTCKILDSSDSNRANFPGASILEGRGSGWRVAKTIRGGGNVAELELEETKQEGQPEGWPAIGSM